MKTRKLRIREMKKGDIFFMDDGTKMIKTTEKWGALPLGHEKSWRKSYRMDGRHYFHMADNFGDDFEK